MTNTPYKNGCIAFDITWDTDGNDVNLPSEVDVSDLLRDYICDNKYNYFDKTDFENVVSDYLSETYGYCHLGFGLKEKENMLEWEIPVSWTMAGKVKIEANTLEEAIAIARDESKEIPLPDDGEYLTGSWNVDYDIDEVRSLFNDNQKDDTEN